ncbi:hypothetical protein BKA62DRAFT_683614 [Auriculariales sp. MPI-PUGE-AT-0066]|nr:hypothetical protein BKA62DRAFT_683614 [Auriculariales sp. MPI-PUGE-AT-0066]
MGYVIGKAEGTGDDWHGHVTAISVAPEYRRLQLASKMMRHLEQVSDTYHHAFFVDLYARSDNQIAIDMYERDGYSVYRQVQGYYAALEPNSIYGSENAYDMRKPCPRDTQRKSVRPNGRNILVPAKQVS